MLWEEAGDKEAWTMGTTLVGILNTFQRLYSKLGLPPENRTRDNEKIGLKFRSENKEFNSDEKIQIHGRADCFCPERASAGHQGGCNHQKIGYLGGHVLYPKGHPYPYALKR
ncbi:MAG: hypothetical protein K0R24_1530 [Gammaproteobacteria bacterium]|nr:hypothetical protein [Gammaproteobacteria bacterium]